MQQESVTSIFQLMRHKMRALGNALLKNPDDVDDAMQDTFCRIWKCRDKISECGNAGGFVLTTMRNVCIDSIRNRGSESQMPIELMPDSEIEDDRAEDAVKDVYDDVVAIISRALSDTQRNIMRMRDVDGMAYSDIARIMHMEETAVRVNLSRARKTVRNIYRKKYE